MDATRAARWTGYYLLYLTAATVVGGGLFLGGAAMTYSTFTSKTWQAWGPLLGAVAPYAVLALVGAVIYRFGTAFAMYRTLTGAVEEELSATYDTEKVKSDILSVLDDRLSEMQSDIRSLSDDEEQDFEF